MPEWDDIFSEGGFSFLCILVLLRSSMLQNYEINASSEMISTHYELCSKYSHICHESFRIVKIAGLLLRFTASSFQLILMDLLASCVFVISIINNKKILRLCTKLKLVYSFFVASFLKILGMTGIL